MLLTRALVFAAAVAAACGPKVGAPGGDAASETDDTGRPPTSGSTAPTDDGEGGTRFGEEGPLDDEGPAESDDGALPTDVGSDPRTPSWCDDPTEVDPLHAPLYLFCLRGLMEFSSHAFSDGSVSYEAYAQFYTVFAEAVLDCEEEILDPIEGVDDCSLRRYGNSCWGDVEEVLWEDAGDVTFVTPRWSVPAMEYGDPVSVIGYQGGLLDMGLMPAHGVPHGLLATGDTTPAFDLPQSVVLPDPIAVSAPAIADSPTISHDDLTLVWQPSGGGFSIWLFLNVPIAGDWDYTLYCRMDDDGTFQVPPSLLELMPLPIEANVYLSRSDARIVGHDGERGIIARASTSTEGHLTIE